MEEHRILIVSTKHDEDKLSSSPVICKREKLCSVQVVQALFQILDLTFDLDLYETRPIRNQVYFILLYSFFFMFFYYVLLYYFLRNKTVSVLVLARECHRSSIGRRPVHKDFMVDNRACNSNYVFHFFSSEGPGKRAPTTKHVFVSLPVNSKTLFILQNPWRI